MEWFLQALTQLYYQQQERVQSSKQALIMENSMELSVQQHQLVLVYFQHRRNPIYLPSLHDRKSGQLQAEYQYHEIPELVFHYLKFQPRQTHVLAPA